MEATKRSIFDFVSLIITLLCVSFVAYKAQECIAKYVSEPESTDVAIERASKHKYPAISICLNDIDSFYGETLVKCNLTTTDYKDNDRWRGTGNDEFCQDPEKLYEEMTGDPFNSVISYILASNDDDYDIELSYYTKDSKWNGRCFTFEAPDNTLITQIDAEFWNDAYVYIHSPGSFFGTDYKEYGIIRGNHTKIDVMHEVFEVLDFDGQVCAKYPYGRDACIFDTIHQESMAELGCTSPYGRNKSNICTDQGKSTQAYRLFEDLTLNNLTDANARCPKSCLYQMTSFSSFVIDRNGNPGRGSMQLKFQRFIKVSRSRYAYTWLELLAEVGGYVGLFLGVSVNQTLSLLKQIFSLFANKAECWK